MSEIFPMLIALAITCILLVYVENKYSLITKIDSKIEVKLNISKKYKALFYIILMIISIFIIMGINPYILEFYSFNKILMGFMIAFICMILSVHSKY